MAGEKAVSTIAKPQMRGFLNAAIKRNLIVSLTLAGISGILFQQLVCASRKKRYAEFYRWEIKFIIYLLMIQSAITRVIKSQSILNC